MACLRLLLGASYYYTSAGAWEPARDANQVLGVHYRLRDNGRHLGERCGDYQG